MSREWARAASRRSRHSSRQTGRQTRQSRLTDWLVNVFRKNVVFVKLRSTAWTACVSKYATPAPITCALLDRTVFPSNIVLVMLTVEVG